MRRGRGAAHPGGGLSEAERERRVAEMMSDATTNEQMRASRTRGQKSTKEQLLDEEAEVRAKRDEAAARDGAAGRGGAGAVRAGAKPHRTRRGSRSGDGSGTASRQRRQQRGEGKGDFVAASGSVGGGKCQCDRETRLARVRGYRY